MDTPSDYARLTHGEVALGGEFRIGEEFHPVIHLAASPWELAAMALDIPQGAAPICLARRQGAPFAYALTTAPEHAIDLYRRGANRPHNWGKIYFGVAYSAVENVPNVFRVPATPQQVAIKRLNKSAIQAYLQLFPDGENPLKELVRMEEIGDNVHVLKHIEALEDKLYIYIVMPKGLGTLANAINWQQQYTSQVRETMPPAQCHEIFCKIIKIICHLLHHGINHHDMSPDNFIFLPDGKLVLFDFALSGRIPIDPDSGHRTLIAPPIANVHGHRTVYGTTAWMDAVVYGGNEPYDGVGMDLYAAGLILYNMSTNEALYRIPSIIDADYNHFIHLEGLWLRNQQTLDNLDNLGLQNRLDQNFTLLRRLFKLSELHLVINPQVMNLLSNMLNEDPALRFTLAEVLESEYVVDFQD